MTFTKIKPKSVVEEVFKQIVEAIESGKLKVGDKLTSESELSRIFGVSRPTVRQAIATLSQFGILEVRHGTGAFVLNNSISLGLAQKATYILGIQDNYAHALEARGAIMPSVVALSAERATKGDLEKMKVALDKICNLAKQNKLFGSAGLDFHMAIARSINNPILEYACLPVLTVWFRKVAVWDDILENSPEFGPGVLTMFYKFHQSIYDAIASKDADQAESAMRGLIEEVEKNTESFLVE